MRLLRDKKTWEDAAYFSASEMSGSKTPKIWSCLRQSRTSTILTTVLVTHKHDDGAEIEKGQGRREDCQTEKQEKYTRSFQKVNTHTRGLYLMLVGEICRHVCMFGRVCRYSEEVFEGCVYKDTPRANMR